MTEYEKAQLNAIQISMDSAKGPARAIVREYNFAFDAMQKEISKLYRDIKKLGITEAQYYNKLLEIGRLQALNKNIVNIFNTHYKEAMDLVRLNSLNTFVNQYYLQEFALQSSFPGVIPFSYINQRAVQLSVWWTPSVWNQIKNTAVEASLRKFIPSWGTETKTLKTLLLKNGQKQLRWIKNGITQGLIQGRGAQETTSLLRQSIEMSRRNILRVVRTETVRNLNGADYLNSVDAKKKGVDIRRQWSAVFDSRTRQQSATMHGQFADENGYFHYPNGAVSLYPGGSGNPAYDIHERCSAINVIESIPTAKRIRDPETGKTKVVSSSLTFPQWMQDNNLVYKNNRLVRNI